MGKWIPKGEWIYDDRTRQIRSKTSYKCVGTDSQRLFLEACADNSTTQKWIWKEIYLK